MALVYAWRYLRWWFWVLLPFVARPVGLDDLPPAPLLRGPRGGLAARAGGAVARAAGRRLVGAAAARARLRAGAGCAGVILDRIAGRRGVILGLFVAVSLLTRAPFLSVPYLDLDEAAHLVGARELMQGGTLYVDVADNRPPLLYGFYALALTLLGPGLASVRLLVAVAVVPLTAFAASAFYRHDRRGIVAGLLYIVYGAAFLAHDMHSASPEVLMLLPLAAALVAVRDPRRHRQLAAPPRRGSARRRRGTRAAAGLPVAPGARPRGRGPRPRDGPDPPPAACSRSPSASACRSRPPTAGSRRAGPPTSSSSGPGLTTSATPATRSRRAKPSSGQPRTCCRS